MQWFDPMFDVAIGWFDQMFDCSSIGKRQKSWIHGGHQELTNIIYPVIHHKYKQIVRSTFACFNFIADIVAPCYVINYQEIFKLLLML